MDDDPSLRHLLAGCDEDQQRAITSSAAPLLVIAGAGSGKTRVLTRRIAWRIASETATCGGTLALTFTRKAASELRQRLRELGLPAPVAAGTFHGVALAQLRQRALDLGRPLPVIVDSKARLLAAVVPDWRARGAGRGSLDRRELLSSLAGEIEWAKARCVPPEGYVAAASAAQRTPVVDVETVATAYQSYEAERRRRRVYDFDDLLLGLADAIARDPDFAAAQRWRFRHLFVDELQDANAAQLRLLDAWLGGRPDLFCVGDARQAIYGWNGADPTAVTSFATRYVGATVLELHANYRSTPQVVAFSRAALDRAAAPTTSARGDGPVPTVVAYGDGDDEAISVANDLRRAHRRGRRWRDCAVLARTNAQLVVIAHALTAAGVPHREGGSEQFLSRPAVRRALEDLGHSPVRRAVTGLQFETWLRELEDDCDHIAVAAPGEEDDVDDVDDPAGGSQLGDGEDIADLAALVRLARDYADLDPAPTPEGFLPYLRHELRADPAPSVADAVELLTFHRAKGLEWPVVFVVGLEDGFSPIGHAKTDGSRSEERRLLYVALTRASDELQCSWARQRRFGRRVVERRPSPYLEPIEEQRQQLLRAEEVDPAVARAAFAASRAILSRATGGGEPSIGD